MTALNTPGIGEPHHQPANAAQALRLAFIALVMLVAGCSGAPADDGSRKKNKSDDDKPEVVIPVEVVNLERGDIFAAYTGSASLEALDEATVVAKVGGEIREILVEEGDRVKRNDVLARLDGDRLRLELEQARANLAKLKQEYQRNIELHEKGLVAASAFETTKYELDALTAAYEMASLEYQYSTIRAPITGVVSQRQVKLGNTIDRNAPTFTLTALDPLVAYLFIPEREFGRISAGQTVKLTIDALPEHSFAGRIARISPTVDPGSGTFKATVEVSDSEGRLKPGMFGRFAIIYDKQPDTLLLPLNAVMGRGSNTAVFIIEDNIARRVDITTGYTWEQRVAILEGLDEQARVVVVGQAALKDGSKVRVIGDPDPALDAREDAEASVEISAKTKS